MARISKTERILNLISFLLKAHVPTPWAEIRGRVVGYDDEADESAIERRFARDKEFLRMLGIPLQYIPFDQFGRSGYFIEKAEYYLPRIEVLPEDMAAIRLVAHLASHAAGPLQDAVRSALQKIQIDFPIPFQIAAEAEERSIRSGRRAADEERAKDNHSALLYATLQSKRIRMRYYTMQRGAVSEREVDPYGMGFTRGAWYLVGRCLSRNETRVFKVSRILGEVRIVHEAEEAPDFQVPSDFHLTDFIGKPAWQLGKGEPVEVKVRFDPTTAWMAANALDSANAFVGDREGSGIVTLRVTALDAFVRWALSFGRHAKVLSPRRVRDRIGEVLRGAAELYRSQARVSAGELK